MIMRYIMKAESDYNDMLKSDTEMCNKSSKWL